jgi:hypothetical protein
VIDPYTGLPKLKAAPEYEDCLRLSEKASVTLLEVYEWAKAAIFQNEKPHDHLKQRNQSPEFSKQDTQ